MREDLEELLNIFSLNDFEWIRARTKHIWPDILQSSKILRDDPHFSKGRKKKVHLFIAFYYLLTHCGVSGQAAQPVPFA